MRWQPALRVAPPYHDDPVYIDALAQSLEAELAGARLRAGGGPGLVPRHAAGLSAKGDPYHCQCQKTARLLRERLGWSDERLRLTFQSRFGTAEWLKPYTDETVKALAGAA